jgi:hypothetical protein
VHLLDALLFSYYFGPIRYILLRPPDESVVPVTEAA